jgi:hypothetical protein
LFLILIPGDSFNHPVSHLPPNLTHLTFGMRFAQPLENLPKGLTDLILPCPSWTVAKDFPYILPPSLKRLEVATVEVFHLFLELPKLEELKVEQFDYDKNLYVAYFIYLFLIPYPLALTLIYLF